MTFVCTVLDCLGKRPDDLHALRLEAFSCDTKPMLACMSSCEVSNHEEFARLDDGISSVMRMELFDVLSVAMDPADALLRFRQTEEKFPSIEQ